MAKKRKRRPSCEECSKAPPQLYPENGPVYTCLGLCSGQFRVGFGGAYAIDWNVVSRVADDLGIKTDELFWSSIQICEDIIIKNLKKGEKNGR